ncbi:MAG TPA: Zn-dependent hydrolase [Terriglobales bacterium]|nr:Zn-dependent hydrolase [Terriglobales bacterium]
MIVRCGQMCGFRSYIIRRVLTRRELLAGFAAITAAVSIPELSLAQDTAALRINAARLQQSLEGLSVYGRPAGGTFADGVSRVAYSDADVAGRKYAMELMRAAGLDPRIDTAGNITAVRSGSDPALKPILFGSHIDSVPSGGNFDGDLGSMSAIEVMHTLNDHNLTTRHPLQVVIWQNEEGGLVGSRIAAGESPDLTRQYNGVRLADGLRKIGGEPSMLAQARIAPGSISCYLELHIEQGGNLDKAGIPIGVVEGIVSIDEYAVEIRGFANHAGTTPMPERRNALLAAAKLIEAVQQVVTREPGRQVGTVGHIEVYPNATNVVPGLVKHSIELRDLSPEKLARLGEEIRRQAQQIARETNTEITITHLENDPPAMASPQIQAQIEQAAAGLGLKTMRLPSGAGHDAQMMAKLAPMGMIFVPSVGGISHSPKEFTRWSDCANGANVLLQTILRTDRL